MLGILLLLVPPALEEAESEVGRWVSSASTCARQTGHVLCERSHFVTHESWKECPHGMRAQVPSAAAASSQRQTGQDAPGSHWTSRSRASIAFSLAGGGPMSPGRSAPLIRSEKMEPATADESRCMRSAASWAAPEEPRPAAAAAAAKGLAARAAAEETEEGPLEEVA